MCSNTNEEKQQCVTHFHTVQHIRQITGHSTSLHGFGFGGSKYVHCQTIQHTGKTFQHLNKIISKYFVQNHFTHHMSTLLT